VPRTLERKFESYQTNSEEPADCNESLPGLVQTTEKTVQASSNSNNLLLDKSHIKLLLPSRRSSEAGSVVDCADIQSAQPPSVLNMPASPSEMRNGKRVRKLKKRKAFKKAPGMEQPESSDTEVDVEASRPSWLRQRRRPSGGSQVSTSSLPADEREGDVDTEGSKKTLMMLCPTTIPEKVDQKSPKHMLEPPQAAPADVVENLDSEESMEITAAGQQQHTDAPVPAPPPALVPDSSRPEPRSLACNEVSSTSDMDLCKSSER